MIYLYLNTNTHTSNLCKTRIMYLLNCVHIVFESSHYLANLRIFTPKITQCKMASIPYTVLVGTGRIDFPYFFDLCKVNFRFRPARCCCPSRAARCNALSKANKPCFSAAFSLDSSASSSHSSRGSKFTPTFA